ncbi:MAG TPA: zf-HC2 domain-containing protein [Candidatus Udaeobacter sp.]|nr:zf-HC2 domain-containing protein [Candidatus Udaeobacter sp.]
MNCEEIQARLSEYLEESLGPTTAKQVESHLSSCRLCRAEADGLALCIQQVSKLPLVEPPMGFAQRVMSHIRELEKQPRFWERLLFPLNIKIPIHATAVVLIGILAIYLFEKQDSPSKNLLQTSEHVTSPTKNEQAAPSSPASSPSATEQQKPTSLPRQQPDFSVAGEEPRAAKDPPRRSALPKIPLPARSPSTPAPATKESTEARALSEESGPSLPQPPFTIQSRERVGDVISGTPVVNPMMPRMGTGQFSLRSEAETESLRAGSLAIAPLADYELVVRRRPSQQDQTLRDRLSPLQKQSDPVAAERMQTVPRSVEWLIAMIPDSGKPHIVWISLAPSQFEQFKRDLISLGTIESESATAFRDLEFASKTDSEILIKLAILPASEASRSNPRPRSNR